MRQIIKSIAKNHAGATSIEYGLLAGMISLVLITALSTMGGGVGGLYDAMAGKLTTAFAKVN